MRIDVLSLHTRQALHHRQRHLYGSHVGAAREDTQLTERDGFRTAHILPRRSSTLARQADAPALHL